MDKKESPLSALDDYITKHYSEINEECRKEGKALILDTFHGTGDNGLDLGVITCAGDAEKIMTMLINHVSQMIYQHNIIDLPRELLFHTIERAIGDAVDTLIEEIKETKERGQQNETFS